MKHFHAVLELYQQHLPVVSLLHVAHAKLKPDGASEAKLSLEQIAFEAHLYIPLR